MNSENSDFKSHRCSANRPEKTHYKLFIFLFDANSLSNQGLATTTGGLCWGREPNPGGREPWELAQAWGDCVRRDPGWLRCHRGPYNEGEERV
ncbi:hypothetical protein CDL15_Pgr009929 [Punica granatum]|uniref:Uncharacterized protein n=1 Tax=Punica granatum TaxID=22663 RepID=A0A218WUE5_PUNGR|nr:hypothetical protein CDL15_Pgr009929 [Punica granatum]